MCIAVWLVPKVKKKLQKAAVCNIIGCTLMVAFHLASYLEGYLGIACTIMMTGFVFFIESAFAFIVAAVFKPVLRAAGFTESRSKVLFWMQNIGFSSVVFLGWVFPYPDALAGDWNMYNRRTILVSWAVPFAFLVLMLLPLHVIIWEFRRVMRSTLRDLPETNPESNKNILDLLKSMINLRNHIGVQLVVISVVNTYNTIAVVFYGQVALPALIFFGVLLCPILGSLVMSYFLYSSGKEQGTRSGSSLTWRSRKPKRHQVAQFELES